MSQLIFVMNFNIFNFVVFGNLSCKFASLSVFFDTDNFLANI